MCQLDAPAVQKCGGAYKYGIRPLVTHCFKRGVDLNTGVGIENLDLQPHAATSRVRGLQLSISICVSRIDEHRDAREARYQLTQKLHPLCRHLRVEDINSCEVAARP